MSESEEYEIEDIIDIWKINNKIDILIKWTGYSSENNTWEPISNLEKNSFTVLKDYLRKEKNSKKINLIK